MSDAKIPYNQLLDELVRLRRENASLEREVAERDAAIVRERAKAANADTILRGLRDGVFTLDRDLRLTYMNQAAADLLGVDRDRAVGVAIFDHVPPEAGAVLAERYRGILRSGRPEEFEFWFDGDPYTDWYLIRAAPIAGGLVVQFEVTTKRHEVEESLRRSESRLRTILETTSNTFMLLDRELTIQALNDLSAERFEAIAGVRPQPGQNLLAICPTAYVAYIEACLSRALAGEAVREEMSYETSDRGTRHAVVHYRPVRGEEGQITGVCISGDDVTDQKVVEAQRRALEERVQHAQRMESLGLLAGGIAHDFNNLLSGILGYANMIRLDSKPGTETQESARMIEKAARRASDLTQQLLGFARRGKLQNVPVDLHGIVTNTVSLLSRTISHRIKLERRLAAPHATVLGDPAQLEQVVMNLAVNARDALDGRGRVAFTTNTVTLGEGQVLDAAPGKYVVLSVEDDGVGIEEEHKGRIFEPFFTTRERGTGMGLATVYGIVRNHGGFVEVDSEVGVGTVLRVYLPLTLQPSRHHSSSSVVDVSAMASERILVIDDEEIVRRVLVRMLQKLGYEVEAVPGGTEGLEAYRRRGAEIDLVILDMMMPDMDGRTCFARLQELDPMVRVLIVTGHAIEDEAQELVERGAAGLLQKPFDVKRLARKLEEILTEGG